MFIKFDVRIFVRKIIVIGDIAIGDIGIGDFLNFLSMCTIISGSTLCSTAAKVCGLGTVIILVQMVVFNVLVYRTVYR